MTLQVKRYTYFPACAARFTGRAGQSWLRRDADEAAGTGAIAGALRVLRAVHAHVFAGSQLGGYGRGPASCSPCALFWACKCDAVGINTCGITVAAGLQQFAIRH